MIASGADGYTLLVNGDQFVTSPHLMGKLVKYDVFRDLIPITRMVTLTGPSTPMGNLLRRYWVPVMFSGQLPDPDCAPVRVKVLGEKLVAFRDTEGTPGLVD